MKNLLLFLLILSFNNFSFATTSDYVEKNTMRDICENIECLDDVVEAYDKWYRLRPFKVMAIDVIRLKERKKLVMALWSIQQGTIKPGSTYKHWSLNIAKKRAIEGCNFNNKRKYKSIPKPMLSLFMDVNNSSPYYLATTKANGKFKKREDIDDFNDRNCRILFSNGNIETAFYNQLMAEPPGCQSGYIDSSTDTDACIRLPENSTESDSGWSCNEGFFKAGDTCEQNIIIPENATALGASWECNTGYAKKFSINENTGLVDFSCRLTLPENASENPYTESGWACNEGFIQDGETCK